MKKLTAEWVRKAEGDYQAAVKLHQSAEVLHDAVCFHCQQAVEKYLKALLQELGLPIPKTHELEQLYTLLLPNYVSLRPLLRGFQFLTPFGVDIRYPNGYASKREAVAALRWAEKTRILVRAILNIRSRPPRGKK